MSAIKFIAAFALAVPAVALAQVGPNPAVSGGSQDPAPGPSTDTATAPDDVSPGNAAMPHGRISDSSATSMNSSDAAATSSTTTETKTSTTTKHKHKPR